MPLLVLPFAVRLEGFMSDKEARKRLQLGGQAVIEGVMMRSPTRIATAVRTPGGRIVVKAEPFRSLIRTYRILNIPIIRGAIAFVETFVVAIRALSYSASQATAEPRDESAIESGIGADVVSAGTGRRDESGIESGIGADVVSAGTGTSIESGDESGIETGVASRRRRGDEFGIGSSRGSSRGTGSGDGSDARSGSGASSKGNSKSGKKSDTGMPSWQMAITIAAAFILGFAIFFYVPLILTGLFGFTHGLAFNLVDGFIRLAFLVLYIFLITRWREMRRIFEYHGAEHKTIFAYEEEGAATKENVQRYATLHPRCSTSFLLLVVFVSVVVFIFLGKPESIGDRLVRFAFIPVIGGISYELLKLSAKPVARRYIAPLVWPGLLLQKLTTKEPSTDQIEVAIAALNACIGDKTLETEPPVL